MIVSELINHLQGVDQDAEVFVDIEVESGFYDVPARHARGFLYYVQDYSVFVKAQQITLLAKSA